jgi:diguanylate cyclase (GGDEF)-like protein
MTQDPMTDPLTGLLKRQAFEEKFSTLLQTAAQDGEPISLAFLDIDYFMQINDNYGHATGDSVLKTLAKILVDQGGSEAIIARYGGDEFAILFRNTVRESALLILERIRAAVEDRSHFKGIQTGVTITGGIASYPIDGGSESEILRMADQALYRAKSTGRNTIRLAYEEKMAPKTSHFTLTQLERLSNLAKKEGVGEAVLLREALDDLLIKYEVNKIES